MTSVSRLATSVNADVTPSIGQFAQQKLPPAILALDLGTTTGWAIGGGSGQITSGTISFRPSRYDGGGIRYLRFRSSSIRSPSMLAASMPCTSKK